MIRIAGSAFIALISCYTCANDYSNELSDLDGLILDNIPQVVTPAKVMQPRVEVSSTLSVLDGELIRRSNIQYVEDLLFFVPGFFVGPYANSYQKVAAYHGTELDRFRRIQVLVNGRSVYSSAYARVEWASLSLNVEDIERVEVNRGPNASSYGSNSFLAVVNIITRSPLDTLGNSVYLSAGDNDESRLYGQHSGLHGNWSYRASASRGKVVGFDKDANHEDRNDGHIRTTGSALLVYEGDDQKVDIDFGASRLEADTTHLKAEPIDYPTGEPTYKHEREHVKIGWESEQSANHTLKGQYYYDHSLQHEQHDVASFGLVLNEWLQTNLDPIAVYSGRVEWGIQETRQHIELQSIWTPTPDYRLVSTASYRQDDAYSKMFFGRSHREEVTQASSNLSYRGYDSIIINAGAMWEHSRLSGEYFSPQLGVTYKLSEQSSIRANVSRAYRTPDIFDQKVNWSYEFNGFQSAKVFATGEQAEEITSYELGFYHNLPAYGLSYDISLYREELENLVPSVKSYYQAVVDGGLLSYGETYQATLEGLEFELDWRTPSGVLVRTSAAFQDTDSTSEKVKSSVTPFVGAIFASLPIEHSVSLNSRYIYAKELAEHDYESVSVWLAHNIQLSEFELNTGVGGSWRLDNNPYLDEDNVLTDRSSYYLYANLTF